MKKFLTSFVFLFLISSAHAQPPCGLTIIQLYSYSSGCGLCNDTIVVAGSGGNGALTFSWSDGQTNDTAVGLCSGVYTCTVSDTANCTSTGTFVLTSTSPPLANSTYTDASCDTCCDGMAVANAYGGTPPYSYLWSDNQVTDTATGLCSGKYFVCVTDANGCSYCDTIEVGFVSGIFSPEENVEMKIYPNPARDKIYFPQVDFVELRDLSGKIILKQKNCSLLSVAELAPGIYFLNLTDDKGNVVRGKIIKNN